MDYSTSINSSGENKTVDLHNESLDWIHSMNHQMDIPGNFIASRLESVTLEEVHNELSALLLATQSHSSALLRSTFNSASLYNDSFKRILLSLWPVREKISDSYKTIDDLINNEFSIKDSVKIHLKRLHYIMYSKLALNSFMLASEHLDNICDEVIDMFKIFKDVNHGSNSLKIDSAIKLIKIIAKNNRKSSTFTETINRNKPSLNWILFELIPKEIRRIMFLINRCRLYENKLSKLIELDPSGSPIEHILTLESFKGPLLQQFKVEYSKETLENNILKFYDTLTLLIEICARHLFTNSYKLYNKLYLMERDSVNNGVMNRERIKDEISDCIFGLTSIIKGVYDLGYYKCKKDLLVKIFSDNFLRPFFESIKVDMNSIVLSFDEPNSFSKFVEFVDCNILNPKNSILMQFLDELTLHSENESFKSKCIFGPLITILFDVIDENYSHIFTILYPEQFFKNYKAAERLLTLIESTCNDSSHLFKWRGCAIANNFCRKFCTSVLCTSFIDGITTPVYNELERRHDIDGNYYTHADKKFYISSTLVVYKQVHNMFSDKNFLFHLFPQYLKGMNDMIKLYIAHIDSFIIHMQSDSTSPLNSSGITSTWPPGTSFTYSTYVLHDVVVIRDCFKITLNARATLSSDQFPGGEVVELGSDCGEIVKILFKIVEQPLKTFFENYKITAPDHIMKLKQLWDWCLDENKTDLGYFDGVNEFKSMFMFSIRSIRSLREYCNIIYQQIRSIETKLVDSITNSLYTSSRCSLQFVQSLSSKFCVTNKTLPTQASDYIKFLIAPLISFVEFGESILQEEALLQIMLKTVDYISNEYIRHIKILFESVENINNSLMNTKGTHLNTYSENFLMVDIEMIKKQISKDVEEFYNTCITRFKIDNQNCSSLNTLLEYKIL